jgi:YidC/Oxa1 family membrane protein insertase
MLILLFRMKENSETVGMQFFFGPNHYQTLKQYDIDLERHVYLGYPVVREVNRYVDHSDF